MRLLNEAKEILTDEPKKYLFDIGWNYKEITDLEREGRVPEEYEKEVREREAVFKELMGSRGGIFG